MPGNQGYDGENPQSMRLRPAGVKHHSDDLLGKFEIRSLGATRSCERPRACGTISAQSHLDEQKIQAPMLLEMHSRQGRRDFDKNVHSARTSRSASHDPAPVVPAASEEPGMNGTKAA